MPALSNPRHERYAQELAKGASKIDAYVAAGYERSEAAASRLSKNVKVHARVRELSDQAAEKAVLTRSWVIERLMMNAERALQEEAVKDNEGNVTGEFKYEGAVANRALELLGKELGMFVERTENVNINHDVSDRPLTEDEWTAEAATSH